MNYLHILVGVVCFVSYLYQFYTLLTYYLEFNFSVTMDERQRSDHIIFPAVTVCVDGWLSAEKLCKYTPEKCNKHDMIYAPGLYLPQANPEMRKNASFLVQELFTCVISSGSQRCATFNCTDRISSTYYRVPSQQCYTFDVNAIPGHEHPFKDCPNQWEWELEMHYKFSKRDTMLLLPRWFYPLFVHQTGLCPPDQLSAVQLLPGKTIQVTVKQLHTFRLPAPYKSMCTDYKSQGSFPEFQGMLNYDLCMQKCGMELEVTHCGCVQAVYEFTASYPFPTCNFSRSEQCKTALTENNTYDVCSRICGLPCEQVLYDVRISAISDEQGSTRERMEKFTLKLRFRSDIEELVLYQPTLTRIELLAYAGGYLGIWLGMSALGFLLNLHGRAYLHKREIQKIVNAFFTRGEQNLRLRKKPRWTDPVIRIH
ncbi:hypothetical protein MRX96_054219 [Rhipicephalus microplus]